MKWKVKWNQILELEAYKKRITFWHAYEKKRNRTKWFHIVGVSSENVKNQKKKTKRRKRAINRENEENCNQHNHLLLTRVIILTFISLWFLVNQEWTRDTLVKHSMILTMTWHTNPTLKIWWFMSNILFSKLNVIFGFATKEKCLTYVILLY